MSPPNDEEKDMEMEDTTVDNPVNDDDNEINEEPEFIQPGEAVEVEVDGEEQPMDDDDEDDNGDDEGNDQERPPVNDLSLACLKSHSGPVYAVAAHRSAADGTVTIVSGGGDDRAYLHKLSTAAGSTTETRPLEYAHTDSVSAVALNLAHVSSDLTKTPPFCAVGAYDGAILIYDPTTGAQVNSLEGPTDVECMTFHPKGGTVLLVGSAADQTVWMFHVVLNQCLQVFVGHEAAVTAVAFTPDGKLALSAAADGTLRVWAPRTGQAKHIFRLGGSNSAEYPPAGLTCLATGGGTDKQLILVGAEDGQAHVCHVGTHKVVATLRHAEVPPSTSMADDQADEPALSVEAVGFNGAFNPNWCATAGVDGTLKIWDLANGASCRQTCVMPAIDGNAPPGITRIAWSPSQTNPRVVCATTDGSVHVWDARNGALVQTLTGNTNVINDLSVVEASADSKKLMVCVGSDDETVRVFEANAE